MSELLSALETIGAVIGAWTLVSLAVAVPIVLLFRRQSASNEARTAAARRAAYREEAAPASFR